MKPNNPKKRRRGFKLGPKTVLVRHGPPDGYDVVVTVLAPGIAQGADSWGPTGLQNPDGLAMGRYRPYDPEDDPADFSTNRATECDTDRPAFDAAGIWGDPDDFHPEGYSPKQQRELEDELRHTRGSWASGWADRSRK